ncbi:MAG: hypothetical protein MR384_08780 [Lachnospiraceae bacterium]|nr:hypothetical protein [Lachnospiraceae bacterium]
MIVELKYSKSADKAIKQIKEKDIMELWLVIVIKFFWLESVMMQKENKWGCRTK